MKTVIKNENKEFFRRIFKNNIVIISHSKTIFKECVFYAKVKVVNSVSSFEDCKFENIEDIALDVEENSQCAILSCSFDKNGSRDILCSQIFASDSQMDINFSRISNGVNSNGIEAENSKITINSSIICCNTGNGASFTNCTLNIKSATILKNGKEKEDFTQLYINASKGIIANSKVQNGVNSNGIAITNQSEINTEGSIICNNIKNGLAVDRYSYVNADNCDICNNGDEYEETLQVWVDNATFSAKECKITNGVCACYSQKNGHIELDGCEIYGNIGGICIFENSSLIVKDSLIYDNTAKPQLWLLGSKATVINSTIKSGTYKAVYAEDMHKLSIIKTNLTQKDIFVKNSQNLSTD